MSSGPIGVANRCSRVPGRADVHGPRLPRTVRDRDVVPPVDDRGALHAHHAALVEADRAGEAVLAGLQQQRVRLEVVAREPGGLAGLPVLARDDRRRLLAAVEGEEGVAQLGDPVVGVRAVGEADRQHVAIAVRRHLLADQPEPVPRAVTPAVRDPHQVVELAGHQPAGGGRDVEVGAVPDDAAGVHPQRPEHEHPVLVEDRHDEQHVPIAQRSEVDERDAYAALVLGVPADRQHVPAADVLGVGGVRGRGDPLRPPDRVHPVPLVEGEPPVDGLPEPEPAEQERPPGLAVEVVEHGVDPVPAAEQRGHRVDLADVLVGTPEVDAGAHPLTLGSAP